MAYPAGSGGATCFLLDKNMFDSDLRVIMAVGHDMLNWQLMTYDWPRLLHTCTHSQNGVGVTPLEV